MSFYKIAILLIFTTSFVGAESLQSSIEEIEKKIEYVRKELRELQKERQSLREDYKVDAEEFQKYRKMILAKKRDLTSEIDSVHLSVRDEEVKKEQYLVKFNTLKNSEDNIKASNKQLMNEIVKNIDIVMPLKNSIPPLTREKIVSSFEILKKEIQSDGVDNIEAINRYFTILDNMDNIPSTVEVTQGNSNVPFLRGMVYKIRIGSVYEAVVNVEGTKAGIWKGYDENDNPIWDEVTDTQMANSILQAIQIREGKAVPSIGQIPFMGYSIHKEN